MRCFRTLLRRHLRPLQLGLSSLLLAACGAAHGAPQEAKGILLVVLDGLRADHVGAFGAERPATPNLDRLAEEGIAFSDAFAAAPLLEPAHIGILSGCAPELSRLFYLHESGASRWQVKPAVPHLAVELLSAGYHTAAFIDDNTLAPSEGFARGFQEYLCLDEGLESAQRASQQGRHLEDWLQSLGQGESWFAYLELADLDRSWTEPLRPWDTYFSPSKGKGMHEVPPVATTDGSFFAIPHSRWRGGSRNLGEYVASYDGHLRRLDQELAAILARLRSLGLEKSTTVVVVGSYGMQFGEAGLYLSSGLLSMADLHVPWIMRPRQGLQQASAGTRVDALVSLIDLAPTLLEMEGLPQPAGMHGLSQAAYLGAEAPAEALRKAAYASNGLVDGYVRVEANMVLEVTRRIKIENRLQRLSWNGNLDFSEGKDSVRYYDRRRTPHPSLRPYVRKSGPEREEFNRRYREAGTWAAYVFQARGVLQRAGLWGEDISPESVGELQRLGYLGPLD